MSAADKAAAASLVDLFFTAPQADQACANDPIADVLDLVHDDAGHDIVDCGECEVCLNKRKAGVKHPACVLKAMNRNGRARKPGPSPPTPPWKPPPQQPSPPQQPQLPRGGAEARPALLPFQSAAAAISVASLAPAGVVHKHNRFAAASTAASTEEDGEDSKAVQVAIQVAIPRPAPLRALRHVTFDELRHHGLASNLGPRPRQTVMAMANTLAHNRVCGIMRSARDVAREFDMSSGADRARAANYSRSIEKILFMPPFASSLRSKFVYLPPVLQPTPQLPGTVPQPPTTVPQPPTTVPQPPTRAPTTVPQPPTTVLQPPTTVLQPPTTVPQLPARQPPPESPSQPPLSSLSLPRRPAPPLQGNWSGESATSCESEHSRRAGDGPICPHSLARVAQVEVPQHSCGPSGL